MAWRDSRRSRTRLLMFSASIMLGIAALVTIGSLRDSLLQALDNEARAMLGADVYIQSKKPMTEKAEAILNKLPAMKQRETAFTTMARTAGNLNVSLVQARAVEEGFPFFGTPISEPRDAWARCLAGEGFVTDPVLADRLGIQPGEIMRIGELELPLLGILRKPPPAVTLMGAFAPEMFFAAKLVPATKLDLSSTFTTHRAWLVFPDGTNVDKVVSDYVRRQFRAEGVSAETVSARKRNVTQVLEKVYSFLSLMAFISLVLGGLGVASAIHVHAVERLPVVATLRCLGCPPGRAMAVYVIQGIWLGIAGAAGGVLLGFAAIKAAPSVLKEVLPIDVETRLSLGVASEALIFGFVLCFCFALLPLLRVRRVPALAAVRAATVSGGPGLWRDPLTWLVLPVVGAALVWLAMSLSPEDDQTLGPAFCGALAVGVLVLAGVSRLSMKVARFVTRPWWPFPLRQGLAGLYRPRNQTLLFLLSVGLSVSLVLATVLTQSILSDYLRSGKIGSKENFFVIDLKPEQRDVLAATLRNGGAEVVSEAPVAKLTLSKVNGKSASDYSPKREKQEKPDAGNTRPPGWLFTQAYRVTWDPKLPENPPGAVLTISVEKNLARSLKVDVKDRLTFSSEGVSLECEVTALHEISWEKMLDNFPIVLLQHSPAAIPATWATGARVRDSAHGATMQREVSRALSGVTVLDITAITAVLADILEKARWLVRSMSLLTVLTGLIIVIAVLLAGRRDRIEESVLLRTLGASRSQIRRIFLWEYLLMGLLASLTGGLLAMGFAWFLASQVFQLPFDAWYLPLVAAVGLVCFLTAILGMLLSRGVSSHPPLAILRGEG